MKKLVLIIFIAFATSCSPPSAGTLGGWDIIVFPLKEEKMESYLKQFYHQYPQFQVPTEKKYIEDYWKDAGYSFLKGKFFYIENEPSRIYYVTYVDAGFGVQHPEYTRIALRAVYKSENDRWYIKDKFSIKEQDDISEVFKNEIILRLEQLTETKSYIQK
ncbi:hypothetical protein [Solitalea canadensis]|uniref:DUF4468 domain-containing protein n=1 Tax=Solitalea canadensis (strain ATCC 29591 / DSM 3403 / JCM 21819 / LMG 8368 / NBRC 15130 / NCIMB 12057 / USAM 9D) TaxID=929556 RepID=H8KTT1_SOLCM|nr:hypothetical protein [Solitalea canadensis]AFD06656.1 hypothetical protein Solca_1588 [Solitalea canadensis DSM 3403]